MKNFTQILKRNYFIPLLLLFFAASFGQPPYTSIPDSNFELALSSYDDISGDHQVPTVNISTITILDVSLRGIISLTGIEAFTNLQDLYCADNALINLNVSMLSNLRYLDCQNNALISLNITGLNNLTQMVCWVNNLATLDLSDTPNLVYLDCDDNAFESLDVRALTNLNQFYCSDNLLTSLDVRGLTNLVNFECTGNFYLDCILVDDVAAAILKTTTVDPDPDAGGAFLWYIDSSAEYSYCNCILTTTWNGSLWNPIAPTDGTYEAIISASYIGQSANINACSLTITNDAFVVIPSGTNVTLNAPITVDPGSTFKLNSNANLIQTNKNSVNSGDITVIRDSSPLYRLDYTLWSSPVSGAQTLGEFSPSTVSSRFYEYNTLTNLYNYVPSNSLFSLAKGYLIRMPNTWVDYIVSPPSTPLSWPGTFTGTPNNGDITYVMSTLGNGYNAVGNPYPSPISMTQFVADNAATITQTLYFWRKTNGLGTAYCTWTPAVSPVTGTFVTNSNTQSVDPLGILQTGQGFFVKASAPGSVTFKNTQRVANSAGQFFKTKQLVDNGRIWLNATNSAGDFSQMAVTYSNVATQGLDIYDGKYINDSPIALTSNINNEEYTIQGRPAFDASDVVDLNFKTNVAGDYTIAIDHVDGLFSGSQDIILKDNVTRVETDLKMGAYTFAAAAGTDNTRFSLKYQKTLKVDTMAFNENSIMVYKNKGTLIVNSGMVDMSNIKVFDIQGRLIAEKKNLKTTTATINNLKITNQVLIVKVTSQDNSVVSKKVIN